MSLEFSNGVRSQSFTPSSLQEEVKRILSHDGLFHVKWLGDRWVPGFVGDGTSYAWWNYLSKVAEICQTNL